MNKKTLMTPRRNTVFVAVALLLAGLVISIGHPDGEPLLERDVNGKVRFFGGHLKATNDFAKKAAYVAHENFSSPGGK